MATRFRKLRTRRSKTHGRKGLNTRKMKGGDLWNPFKKETPYDNLKKKISARLDEYIKELPTKPFNPDNRYKNLGNILQLEGMLKELVISNSEKQKIKEKIEEAKKIELTKLKQFKHIKATEEIFEGNANNIKSRKMMKELLSQHNNAYAKMVEKFQPESETKPQLERPTSSLVLRTVT